jgi:hypothetical protein
MYCRRHSGEGADRLRLTLLMPHLGTSQSTFRIYTKPGFTQGLEATRIEDCSCNGLHEKLNLPFFNYL